MEHVKKDLSNFLEKEIVSYHETGFSTAEAIIKLGAYLEENHSLNISIRHRKLIVEYHYQELDKSVSMKKEWENLGKQMGWIS